jgi:hypothetical protein
MTPEDPEPPGAKPGTGNREAKPEPNPGRDSPATTIDTPLTAPPGLWRVGGRRQRSRGIAD